MLGNGQHVLGNEPHVLGNGATCVRLWATHVLGNGPNLLGKGALDRIMSFRIMLHLGLCCSGFMSLSGLCRIQYSVVRANFIRNNVVQVYVVRDLVVQYIQLVYRLFAFSFLRCTVGWAEFAPYFGLVICTVYSIGWADYAPSFCLHICTVDNRVQSLCLLSSEQHRWANFYI